VLLNEVNFQDGFLGGFFVGDIGTEDVNRRANYLIFDLKHRGDVLDGGLIGRSRITTNRVGNALTHWVELRRR